MAVEVCCLYRKAKNNAIEQHTIAEEFPELLVITRCPLTPVSTFESSIS